MSYEELAGLLENKPDKSIRGFVYGTVISVNPIKIEILDGAVILDDDDIYVPQFLLSTESDIELDKNILHTSATSPQMSNNFKAKLTRKALNVGDELGLIANGNGQKFLLLDVVKRGDLI